MVTRRMAWGTLAVLFAINAMNFYDRIIPGAVLEDLREQFDLSSTKLGFITTMFLLTYAAVGLPLGRLADRSKRTRLLAFGVGAWSILTAGSGFARNYMELLLWRVGVGVGEATCAPAASSLIGDLFPPARRAMAMSVFMMGLPLGNAAGYAVSGVIAHQLGWEYAFFVALIPGLACALIVWFMPEPPRGTVEAHGVGNRRREGNAFWLVLSIPTMWWIIASGALHNFNMYAIGQFLGSFMITYHGIDKQSAGLAAMAIYGLSGVPGLIIGGVLGDRVRQGRINGRLLIAWIAIAISVPCMLLALALPVGDVLGFGLLMGTGCGVMYVYYSTVYSTIHDVVEPALRGTAMAIYFFAMYIGGAALGALTFGLVADHFTERAARAAGVTEMSTESLRPFLGEGFHVAMYILPALGAVLALVLWAASRTVTRDVQNLQAFLASDPGQTH